VRRGLSHRRPAHPRKRAGGLKITLANFI
jgi:hypothetical protein